MGSADSLGVSVDDKGKNTIKFVIQKTELISLKKKSSQSPGIDSYLECSTVARQFIEGGFNTQFSPAYKAMEESAEFTVSV
jgi:hypothetical protein